MNTILSKLIQTSLVALTACWLVGCGASSSAGLGSAGGSNGNSTGDTFTFSDDQDDPAQAALPFVEDELLVQPFPGADAQALSDLYAATGAQPIDEVAEIDLTVLKVAEGQLAEVAGELAASSLIEGIHKNYTYEAQATPDDPFFSRQSDLEQVRATEAWDLTQGSEDVIIAIVDTGVESDHPDLADKIAGGWNVYDNDRYFADINGHGTEAAGVAAAATDNEVGLAGIAWDNPILAVRVTNDRGTATSRHIAAGILWAVGHGAKVINVSFAPLWSNSLVRSAAQQAYNRGCLVVISAGNEGGLSESTGYDEALFVGAVDGSDEIASFSDQGPFVDLVAPGVGVRATRLDGEYGLVNGTSFAAPIVSGAAALAWSVNPDLRPATIVAALREAAVDLGSRGEDDTYGAGIVDIRAAVEAASEAFDERDTMAPTLRVTSPSDGATLSSRTRVKVSANDAGGVADVVLSVDGVAFATDTRSPFQFVIDPSGFTTGTHELTLVATDFAGNASDEETVNVRFREPRSGGGSDAPTIEFDSPAAGTKVTSSVTIEATIGAESGLALVEWFVDGDPAIVNSISGDSSHVTYLWRTSGYASGSHTITLVVTDENGDQASGALELIKQ